MKKQGKKNRIFAGIAAAVMAVSATAVGVRSYSANAADLELDNYAKLLQYSLYFYDANMCGDKVGETSAFSWRDNCHTGDVALGGFHDAIEKEFVLVKHCMVHVNPYKGKTSEAEVSEKEK